METILNNLVSIIRDTLVLSPNVFYSIATSGGYITLQGKYDSDIVKELGLKGFVFEINDRGHAVAEKKIELQIPEESFKVSVRIVLT